MNRSVASQKDFNLQVYIDEMDSFLNILDTLEVATWDWNIQSNEIVVNEKWAEMLGYTKQELQPTSIDTWKELTHPVDLKRTEELLKKHFEGKLPVYDAKIRMKHKDGHWVFVHDKGRVYKHDKYGNPLKMSGTHTNVSSSMQSTNNLKYRLSFERLISSISQRMITVSYQTFTEEVNEALAQLGVMTNVDRVYLFTFKDNGETMDNTHEWCAPTIEPQKEQLQGLPSNIFPWWMEKLNRQEPIVLNNLNDLPKVADAERQILEPQGIKSLLVVPVLKADDLIGFIGFDSVQDFKNWSAHDVQMLNIASDLIANAFQSVEKENKLLFALEKAKESDRLKSAFLATMNHELRTPLNHIIGFSNLIHEEVEDDSIQEFARTIETSGNNLLQIVEDIFDLAIAEQAEVNVNESAFVGIDFYMESKQSLENIFRSAHKSDVQLVFNPDKQILTQVLKSDKNKINQVLANLFKNAVKFTDSGQIEYGFFTNGLSELTFYVKDTGIGIEKSKQKFIFEFFRQANETDTREHDGVGIGLAISQKICEAMKGRLQLESDLGEGSIFYFTVPIQVLSAMPSKDGGVEEKCEKVKNKRILLVDDDDASRSIVAHHLSGFNQLSEANSGEASLRMLEENGSSYDLVLMDLKMPGMDGYEATKLIKQKFPALPVIALTAYSMQQHREKALKYGCTDVLTKPVNKIQLYKKINEMNR